MKFPKYWALGEAVAAGPSGKRLDVAVWRWSDTSQADADALAREAADELAKEVTRKTRWPDRHYGYADRPLREPIIQEFRNDQGEQTAVVSRNSYGCLVLNTSAAMFIDVDLPEPKVGCLGLILGKRGRGKAAALREEHEKAELARLGEWLMQNRDWAVRIYRTRAGLRYLVTHAPIAPGSEEARFAMVQLNADPLYSRLCNAQQSYRARLTPKAWRVGLKKPPSRWPFPDADAESAFAEWHQRYTAACAKYATCSFLGALGPEAIHPHIAGILNLHDETTRVEAQQPLA
jgi:hypothetical protein